MARISNGIVFIISFCTAKKVTEKGDRVQNEVFTSYSPQGRVISQTYKEARKKRKQNNKKSQPTNRELN